MSETKKPRIPTPPSKEGVDRISEEQAMIADEWAPNDPPKPDGKDVQVD